MVVVQSPPQESRAWRWASASEEKSGYAPKALSDLTNRFLRENSEFFPKEMISVYKYQLKIGAYLPRRRASSPREIALLYFIFIIKGHGSGINKEDS